MKNQFLRVAISLAFVSLFCTELFSQNYFKNWEKGTSPQEVGKRVAENWLKRPFEYESGKRKFVIYPEICTWYGALTVANRLKDTDLQQKLVAKYNPFLTEEGKTHINPQAHVDYSMVGSLPLEIFIQSKNKKYLEIGQAMADKQWSDTTPDGITKEARYWIDDMYMITILQTQAYRATKDKKYLDRAALTRDAVTVPFPKLERRARRCVFTQIKKPAAPTFLVNAPAPAPFGTMIHLDLVTVNPARRDLDRRVAPVVRGRLIKTMTANLHPGVQACVRL